MIKKLRSARALIPLLATVFPAGIPAGVTAGVIAGVVAGAARAQDPIPVRYKNGASARVQVLGVEGDRVRLRVLVLGGSMDVKKRLSDFEPDSGFRIEMALDRPSTYEEHFAFAKKAAAMKLLGPAGAQARAAVATLTARPDAAAKTEAVRSWAATTLEGWLHDAVRRGDLHDAQHFLKLLSTRLSDQRTEDQLDALAGAVEGLKERQRARRKAERQVKMAAQAREAIDRKLKPIRSGVERGDRLYRQAVAKSRQMTQSANLAEKSIETYRRAWKSLQSLQRRNKDDEYLTREAEGIAARLESGAIQSALHAGNMLCVRSDYKGALDWTTKVLEMDPDNAEAKALRRTIQIAAAAASSDWGWGWNRYRRVRRPVIRRH